VDAEPDRFGYPATLMSPQLRAHVEKQLLLDLAHYGLTGRGLRIDWSDPTQEGHQTRYLDGVLEEMSDVMVRGSDGVEVARGWVDFVHGADDAPLFVFWLYLDALKNGSWERVKDAPVIPAHIWEQLPERSKDLCLTERAHDSRWSKDPLVANWREQRP
jgi:hypothetical protein